MEERLIQTEQHLINAKASWAEAEHEKEILHGRLHMLDEILRSHYEGGLQALLDEHQIDK